MQAVKKNHGTCHSRRGVNEFRTHLKKRVSLCQGKLCDPFQTELTVATVLYFRVSVAHGCTWHMNTDT